MSGRIASSAGDASLSDATRIAKSTNFSARTNSFSTSGELRGRGILLHPSLKYLRFGKYCPIKQKIPAEAGCHIKHSFIIFPFSEIVKPLFLFSEISSYVPDLNTKNCAKIKTAQQGGKIEGRF